MRTQCTQMITTIRLTKQSWFVCANFAGFAGYEYAVVEAGTGYDTIDVPNYTDDNKVHRRT